MDHVRHARRAVVFLLLSIPPAALGCSTPRRIAMTPTLGVVDAARPMVRYPAQQGKACGENSLLGAIGDLKRIQGADGFVEVVVEESGDGDDRCTTVTAHPISYGTATKQLTPAGTSSDIGKETVVIPGRDAAPALVDPCVAACAAYAPLSGKTGTPLDVFTESCKISCGANAAYRTCVEKATNAANVAPCEALVGGGP